MPCIETIKGVKMYIYSNDHVPPHIHAIYGEHEALIDIMNLTIIVGSLPSNKRKIAIRFIEENQDDLLETFYQLNPNIQRI
jgi:Domain of unknown function (DUF4160)